MTKCLWCDDEADGALCCPCQAVNDGPTFRCSNPRHTVPSLGTSCAACDGHAAAMAARAARNAPHIAQLLQMRADLIRDWATPWPGVEHGKALVGMMIDGALADLGHKGATR